MAAPLIFSGDMARLDPFTLNVLCNAEVIEVDQDTLGRQVRIVSHPQAGTRLGAFVLLKDLEDGSKARGSSTWARQKRRSRRPGAIWASAASSRSVICGGKKIFRRARRGSRPWCRGTA